MPDTRHYAYAEIDLYDEGQGFPALSERGFGFVDLPAESFAFGTFEVDTRGMPKVEAIEGIGLTHRPFINFKNTTTSHWTVSPSASWEESAPFDGIDKFTRLVMFDTTAGIQFSATSQFSLPANPDFAVTLAQRRIPPDWDQTIYPVYTRLELAGKYGVHFEKGKAFIVRWFAGNWRVAREIQNAGVTDGQEIAIFIRCQRGSLGVSLDFGKNYTWYSEPGGISIPSGTCTLRGQGNVTAFGFHQIEYKQGTYSCQTRDNLAVRDISTIPTIGGIYESVDTNSVVFADNSNYPGKSSGYTVTLTPKVIAAGPFSFYKAPSVQHVRYNIPFDTDPLSGLLTFTSPWNDHILAVDIDKPYEPDASTCVIRLSKDATWSFSQNLRDRLVKVKLGHVLLDGTHEEVAVFVGEIDDYDVVWDKEFGQAVIEIRVHNISRALKRTEWKVGCDDYLLSDQSVNDANDFIIASEGFGASFRTWNSLGDQYLDPGLAENPCERTKAREKKWETLKRINGLIGLEVIPTDEGQFITLPFGWVNPQEWDLTATPDTVDFEDIRTQLAAIRMKMSFSDSVTCILVTATDPNGNGILRYAIDTSAESLALAPVTGRYTQRRAAIQEEIPGTCDAGIVTQRVVALANQFFPIKTETGIEIPVDIRMSRKDRVNLYGLSDMMDIPEGAAHIINSLRHSFRAREGLGELRTVAGLTRYVNGSFAIS